ncbi:hypothetical protein DFH06DRAFT_1333622 [Mycena polygramma]|nr:hypothetical protein DFH06DRAFT_1333622 [Mycena polygramma]
MSCTSTSATSLASNIIVSSRAPLEGSAVVSSKSANLTPTDGLSETAPSTVRQKQNNSSPSSSTTSMPVDDPCAPLTGGKNHGATFPSLQSPHGSGCADSSSGAKKKGKRSLFSKLTRSSSSSSPSSSPAPSRPKPKTKVRALPQPTQHMTSFRIMRRCHLIFAW